MKLRTALLLGSPIYAAGVTIGCALAVTYILPPDPLVRLVYSKGLIPINAGLGSLGAAAGAVSLGRTRAGKILAVLAAQAMAAAVYVGVLLLAKAILDRA